MTGLRPVTLAAACAACLVAGLVAGVLLSRPLLRATDAARVGAAAAGEDGSPVVASVGGEDLTRDELDLRFEKVLSPEARRATQERGGKARYLHDVVDELLLAQEARRRGLDQRPDVKAAIRTATNHALVRPLLEEEIRQQAIPEQELRAYFEAHRDEWGSPTRVRVREIVAATGKAAVPVPAGDDALTVDQARAKLDALRARLERGEDFGAIAREHSEAVTGALGGEIGWVVAGRFFKAYEEAALVLQPGETSPLVETPDGFVLLRCEEREEGAGPTYEEKREEILQLLLAEDPGALQRRLRLFVDDLNRRTDVVVNEDAAAAGPSR